MKLPIRFTGAALSALLIAGCVSSAPPPPEPEAPPKDVYQSLAMLGETMTFLKANYADSERVTYELLLEGALRGMLQELDPYSTYDPPREWQDKKSQLDGEKVGVGITVIKNEREPLVVIGVVKDSPAAQAGLRPGDRVMELNGRATPSMSFEHCREEVVGPIDSELTLKVIREGENNKLEFKLPRRKLVVEPVPLAQARMFEGGIGYVKIDSFNRLTASLFDQALAKLRKEGELKGLVIDLRNNPGGMVDAAVELVSRLLARDQTVFWAAARNNGQRYRAQAAGVSKPDLTLPVAVLINRYSASAAEIVAGALQDHKRATVIGDRSFGKGSIQRSWPLSNGGAIRFTVAYYQTPEGRMIDHQGVSPDLALPVSERESLNPPPPDQDVQLQKALELLRKNDKKEVEPEKKENFSSSKPS